MDIHKDSAFGRLEIVETGRRRRWSTAAKERIVLESMSGPRQIAATARRHGIARSLLVIWRRAFQVRQGFPSGLPAKPIARSAVSGFVPAVLVPEASMGRAGLPSSAVPVPGRTEIVLVSGHRIIVEGALDTDAVLKLARGLEALP